MFMFVVFSSRQTRPAMQVSDKDSKIFTTIPVQAAGFYKKCLLPDYVILIFALKKRKAA